MAHLLRPTAQPHEPPGVEAFDDVLVSEYRAVGRSRVACRAPTAPIASASGWSIDVRCNGRGADRRLDCKPLTSTFVVGTAGFEPTTAAARTLRATKLRHVPYAPDGRRARESRPPGIHS